MPFEYFRSSLYVVQTSIIFFVEYVASYSAPKGSSPGPGGRSVRDSSYDGTELDSFLVNGLGQLTDGILGEISEILTSSVNDTNWVGWSDRTTIQIVFRFQEVREFQNCTVHVARIPQLHVETFSMMRVWFSIDGENYRPEIEKSEWPVDVSSAAAETVLISIPLESKIGQFVKVEFSLAAKWLLLSEITFYTGRTYVCKSKGKNTDNEPPRLTQRYLLSAYINNTTIWKNARRKCVENITEK
ncbi:hypothetical protein E2986_12360 [Frieseomelitta varia]|uniref:Discoidin domain-containing protein n=1 Tax=Frieseomelitta varia TaxID=561572 RepID=A0A833RE21_9HYME|nr:hypothetical protein E2986_12360 [Frieseomelitta varia]